MAVDLIDIAVCTAADVQVLYGQSLDTYPADMVDTLNANINFLSAILQGPKFLNRKIKKQEYTEYYSGVIDSPCRPRFKILVEAPPFRSAPQVWLSPDQVFDGTSLLVEDTDYVVDYEAGILTTLSNWGSDRNSIKVTYPGGIVLYDDPTLDSPEDLRWACATQVSHWYKNRNEPGATAYTSPGGQGGAVKLYDPTQLLPTVWNALSAYRRYEF